MDIKQKAYQFAVECLRPYIERGDSYEHTAHGQLGCYCGDYAMGIGGYFNGKKLTIYQVGVSKVEGQEVEYIFSLKEIFEYVLNTKRQQSLF
jgi:hypothetical protein